MNNTIKLDAGIFISMTEYNGLYYINRSRINNNYDVNYFGKSWNNLPQLRQYE